MDGWKFNVPRPVTRSLHLVRYFRLPDGAVSRDLIQRNRRTDDMVSVDDVVSPCPFA